MWTQEDFHFSCFSYPVGRFRRAEGPPGRLPKVLVAFLTEGPVHTGGSCPKLTGLAPTTNRRGPESDSEWVRAEELHLVLWVMSPAYYCPTHARRIGWKVYCDA